MPELSPDEQQRLRQILTRRMQHAVAQQPNASRHFLATDILNQFKAELAATTIAASRILGELVAEVKPK